jgi:hypothetical protein
LLKLMMESYTRRTMINFSDQSFRFLSGGRSAPNRSTGSYKRTGRRFEHGWLACYESEMPSASGAQSRRVPRLVLRSFALKRDLSYSAAEGSSDRDWASRVCAKRRLVTGYERGNLFGAGNYNDRNPFVNASLEISVEQD